MQQQRNKRSVILLLILAVLIAGGIGWFGNAVLFTGEVPAVSYEILSTEEFGSVDNTEAVIEVRFQETHPTIRELRRTTFEIWNQGNRGWDLLTIHIYLPGMELTEEPFAIAEFTPAGIRNIRVLQESVPE